MVGGHVRWFDGGGGTRYRKLYHSCLRNTLKHIILGLGGNDASVAYPDVDIAKIDPAPMVSTVFNGGQVCVATKRIKHPPRNLCRYSEGDG